MNTVTILISQLNQKHEDLLKEIWKENLSAMDDTVIEIILDEIPEEQTSEILKQLNELAQEKDDVMLEFYYPEETIENVTVLDIRKLNEEKHPYLKELFRFPDYYGENLDSLYECLSEMNERKIVVTGLEAIDDFSLKVLSVMEDVAEEYHNISLNYDYDELLDEE